MYDCIIIGCGVIGAATAFHLKCSNPSMKILIIDQYAWPGAGNTGKSAALFRNIFSSETSRQLVNASIRFYQTLEKELVVDRYGYLWLFSEKNWDTAQNVLNRIGEENIITSLAVPDIRSIISVRTNQESNHFPRVYKALLGKWCGSLSAVSLVRYYVDQFMKMGGEIQFNTKIVKINFSDTNGFFPPWKKSIVTGLISENGDEFHAGTYCSAAGAWTHELLIPYGINPQVLPKKRQLFSLRIDDASSIAADTVSSLPAIILPAGGIYIKPALKKNMIVVGCADSVGNPFARTEEHPQAHEKYYTEVIRPVLTHYFPDLSSAKLITKWAGYYSYNTWDLNPVVEQYNNLVWVSGTSGSGIMKADAVGRITAGVLQGSKEVYLFDSSSVLTADLSLTNRNVDKETLVI